MATIDALLEGAALVFSGLAFWNRNRIKEGKRSLGDLLESTVAKSGRDISKIPVKPTVLSPRSVDDRVRYIGEMIKQYREDPEIRKMASGILGRRCGNTWCVPEKNWKAEVGAVFDFTRKNVRYTRDITSKDTFVNPVRTLTQYHLGDCDDMVISGGSLLQHIGFPIKLRVIQTTGNNDFNHIYLLAGLPPTRPTIWLPFDASVDQPLGFQAPAEMVIRYKDFLLTSNGVQPLVGGRPREAVARQKQSTVHARAAGMNGFGRIFRR